MTENKNKFYVWCEAWWQVSFYFLMSALIVAVVPFGLSIAEKIAIPLGIGLGFAIAVKVRPGLMFIDTWGLPILFAAVLASVLGPLFADDPSWYWKDVLMRFTLSAMVSVLVVFLDHLALLLVSSVMDRISMEKLHKEDHSGTVSPAAGPADIEAASTISDMPMPAEIRDTHFDDESRMRSAGALFDVIGILSIAVGLLSIVATAKDSPGVLALTVTIVGVFFLAIGYGLSKLKPWARMPATILSIAGLFVFPIGTLYFSILLYRIHSAKGQMVFSREYREVVDATPSYEAQVSTLVVVLLLILLAINAFFVNSKVNQFSSSVDLNTYMIPTHISGAMSKAEPLKKAIEEFRRVHGRFPASVSEIQETITVQHQYVSDVRIAGEGVIRLTFAGYMQEIEGKTISLIPTAEDGDTVRWNCRSSDISVRFLPSGCR